MLRAERIDRARRCGLTQQVRAAGFGDRQCAAGFAAGEIRRHQQARVGDCGARAGGAHGAAV